MIFAILHEDGATSMLNNLKLKCPSVLPVLTIFISFVLSISADAFVDDAMQQAGTMPHAAFRLLPSPSTRDGNGVPTSLARPAEEMPGGSVAPRGGPGIPRADESMSAAVTARQGAPRSWPFGPVLLALEPTPAYRAAYELRFISIVAGATITIPVGVTNTGTVSWPANSEFRLSYHWFQGDTPISIGGLRTPLPQSLVPGQGLTLDAQLQAPPTPGPYTLKWDMVREGEAWFSTQGAPTGNQLVTVTAPPTGTVTAPPTATVTGAPYGATYLPTPISTKAGETSTSRVRVTNTGTLTWQATSKFRLSYHWYQGNEAIVFDGVRTFLPPGEIAPGQGVLIEATVKAPSVPGTYMLKWDMVHEDITWFSWKGVRTGDEVVKVE